jgi:hypothetical protein
VAWVTGLAKQAPTCAKAAKLHKVDIMGGRSLELRLSLV